MATSNIQAPVLGQYARQRASLGRLVQGSQYSIEQVALLDTEGYQPQSVAVAVGSTPDASAVYSLTIAGSTGPGSFVSELVSYTTGGSPSVAELVEGWEDAINALPILGALIQPPVATTGLLTLNGKPGVTFTVAETADPGSDVTITTTAATQAPQYYFGDAVEVRPQPSGGPLGLNSLGCRRPLITGARAVLTITIGTNANTETCSIALNHTPFGGAPNPTPLAFTAGANDGATQDAIVAAATARFPTALVAESGGAAVTVTFPAGDVIALGTITDSGSLVITAAVVAGALPTFALVLDSGDVPQFDSYTNPPTTPAQVLGPLPGGAVLAARYSDGQHVYAVAAQATVALGEQVYVGTDGAERGKLFNAASITRIPWSGAKFYGMDPNNSALCGVSL